MDSALFNCVPNVFLSVCFSLCLSSGAARASCTWSFRGRKRTSTSLARTAPLSTACLRSSISTLVASCPSRVRNTCPCSTLWPSGHYSALGQCSAVLTGPLSGSSMACLSGQSPGGSREDEQWHPKTADPDSPHWLTDDRPTGLLHTVSYEQAQCCRGLYYFILFYLWQTAHSVTLRTDFPLDVISLVLELMPYSTYHSKKNKGTTS